MNYQVSGYEDAKKQFGTWDDDDPKWKNYMGLAKKMVTDSNAVAQEKGNFHSSKFEIVKRKMRAIYEDKLILCLS